MPQTDYNRQCWLGCASGGDRARRADWRSVIRRRDSGAICFAIAPYGPVENPLSPSEPLQRSSAEPNVFDLTLPSSLKNSLNSAFIRSAHFFTVRSMPLLIIESGLSLNMM